MLYLIVASWTPTTEEQSLPSAGLTICGAISCLSMLILYPVEFWQGMVTWPLQEALRISPSSKSDVLLAKAKLISTSEITYLWGKKLVEKVPLFWEIFGLERSAAGERERENPVVTEEGAGEVCQSRQSPSAHDEMAVWAFAARRDQPWRRISSAGSGGPHA